MNEKPDSEPDETYVLDDETLEELDGASLTSLVSDLTNTMKRPRIESPGIDAADVDANDIESDDVDSAGIADGTDEVTAAGEAGSGDPPE